MPWTFARRVQANSYYYSIQNNQSNSNNHTDNLLQRHSSKTKSANTIAMSSTVTRRDVCEHCHSEIPSSGETFLANGDEIICDKCHGDGPSEKCPICDTNEVNYTTQGCNHQFCRQCITQWFAINKNCPLCRNSHVLDSIAYFSSEDDSSIVETIDKQRCTLN